MLAVLAPPTMASADRGDKAKKAEPGGLRLVLGLGLDAADQAFSSRIVLPRGLRISSM
jgi:hypothetical protein